MAVLVKFTKKSSCDNCMINISPEESKPLCSQPGEINQRGDSKPVKVENKAIASYAQKIVEEKTISKENENTIKDWDINTKGKLLVYFLYYCTEDGKDKDINKSDGEALCNKDKDSEIFQSAFNISFIDQHKRSFEYLWRGWKGKDCEEVEETFNDILTALNSLYQSLREDNLSELEKQLEQLCELLDKSLMQDLLLENFTLLQYACRHGKLNLVKYLMDFGFDITYAPVSPQQPIQLSCKYGHPEILKYLIDKGALSEKPNPIRSTRKRTLYSQAVWNFVPPENSTKCLEILLEYKNKHTEVTSIGEVNDTDDYGRTPLHYAVMRKNDDCILLLLRNGAHMDAKDNFKEIPLSSMPESALEKFLDSMISFNDYKCKSKDKRNDSYDLQFNFRDIFKREGNNEYSFSMDLLKKIKREKRLKNLIGHPIISIILHFQYYRIQSFFYFYLVLYFLFLCFYTPYVVLQGSSLNFTKETSNHLQQAHDKHYTATLVLRILSFIILAIFSLLEIVKFFGGSSYVSSLDNLIRFITFSLSWVVLIIDCVQEKEYTQWKAVSILMVCFEFFLVLSKYPSLTYHIITFRTASLKLIKFLFFHAIILLGFALSFHILFRKSKEKQAEIFQKFSNATFKTIIMLTSEFEAGVIPFYDYGVSYFIFILFIFFVTIVLFNLMIALALSKVNDMERNKLLYRSFTEIDMIVHFEEYYLEGRSKWQKASQKLCKFCQNLFKKCFGKRKEYVSEKEPILKIKGNQLLQSIKFETYPKRRVVFTKNENTNHASSYCYKCCNWCKCSRGIFKHCGNFFSGKLNDKVVIKAWEIAAKNKQKNENEKNI